MNRTEPKAATAQQVAGAVKTMAAVADAIRELGRVASGHLYATLMGLMSLRAYEAMIAAMVTAGAIRRDGDLLVWVDVKEGR